MSGSVRLRRAASPVAQAAPGARPVRLLSWLAILGIGSSLLLMIGASLIRQDWMYPAVRMPATGPPWEVHVAVPGRPVIAMLWIAGLLGACGVAAGLAAVRRGARWPIGLILAAAAVAVLTLALLPPVGSTDALDYAAYGRIALLGHNPYLATPSYLRTVDPSFGVSIPLHWQHQVSLYGPAATLEQYLAAWLGGNSIARVVFWLKLWNAIGFGLVAFALDRVQRHNLAARLRAHLLWTLNPLLLWDLIAAGHVDALAAGAGLLGLLVLGQRAAGQPPVWRALVAGALVGLAADIKIDYALFAVGLAWALRRSLPGLVAAAAGALAVLGPSYAWLGTPAIHGLFARQDKTAQDSFYRFAALTNWHYLSFAAGLLFIALAALLLHRLPAGDLLRPAIRPALAVILAWLLVWPYTLPWYDAMIFCVLALFPASRLDWLLLIRLGAATLANMPGDPISAPGSALKVFDRLLVHTLAPAAMLGVAVAVVLLAVSGQLTARPRRSSHRQVPAAGVRLHR